MKFSEYRAKSLSDLVDYYCYRCDVGVENCKISVCDCCKVAKDKDFERVTLPKAVKKNGMGNNDK